MSMYILVVVFNIYWTFNNLAFTLSSHVNKCKCKSEANTVTFITKVCVCVCVCVTMTLLAHVFTVKWPLVEAQLCNQRSLNCKPLNVYVSKWDWITLLSLEGEAFIHQLTVTANHITQCSFLETAKVFRHCPAPRHDVHDLKHHNTTRHRLAIC